MGRVTIAGRALPERESRRGTAASSALLISKPGIAGGVTLAGLSGMVLAGRGLPPAGQGLLCLACILMAAAGSAVINGLLDREIDSRMRRVASRTEALENVGNRGALLFSLALIACSLAVSVRFLNGTATLLLAGAVAGYTLLYTLFLKRRSPYGTVPGGIPGALPVLIGYGRWPSNARMSTGPRASPSCPSRWESRTRRSWSSSMPPPCCLFRFACGGWGTVRRTSPPRRLSLAPASCSPATGTSWRQGDSGRRSALPSSTYWACYSPSSSTSRRAPYDNVIGKVAWPRHLASTDIIFARCMVFFED
ncbi:MAG: UbiA prenyltransferase [Actinobacteria bacterium]|nr:UbiA prenyltransferase [Actinomycetota bacterium]